MSLTSHRNRTGDTVRAAPTRDVGAASGSWSHRSRARWTGRATFR